MNQSGRNGDFPTQGRSLGRATSLTLVVASLFAAMAVAAAEPARAARDYLVVACNSAVPGLGTNGGAVLTPDPTIVSSNDFCASGGGLGHTVRKASGTVERGRGPTWSWSAPEGTSIAGVDFEAKFSEVSNWVSRVWVTPRSGSTFPTRRRPFNSAGLSPEYQRYSFDPDDPDDPFPPLDANQPPSGLTDTN